MTNLTNPGRLSMDPVLGFLFDQTHPVYLARLIEEPIDRALRDFLYHPEPVFSSRYFHRVVAELMRHLIWRCGRVLSHSTLEQALEEGLMLLEHRYSGPAGRGYEAALVDAAGEGGIDSVLLQTGLYYRERARSDHLQFLFHRHYFCLEPHRRCKIVQNLMATYGPELPPKLRRINPVALIEDLPILILTLQGVEGDLQTLLTAGI